MVEAASSALKSNIDYGPENHFPLENIPYGVFENGQGEKHVCTRIGDFVIDLAVLFAHGAIGGPQFQKVTKNVFDQPSINEFMSLGKEAWHEARVIIQKLFTKGDTTLSEMAFKDCFSYDFKSVKMCMPVDIRDYTDFYSSKNHAYNVGVMFRGPDNALQPNWLHLPVGYHGRASTVVISGTDIIRPKGQVSTDQKTPQWSQC